MIPRTIAFALLLTVPALAGDWPQWRGPLRTGHVPAGEAVPSTLPADPNVIWQVPVGDGFASPVVAGGRVFHLENENAKEVARAFDAATGKEIWKKTIFSSHRDGFGIGPRTTPVVDGERLFVQSAKGEFQCLNVADGALIWRTNFVEDFGAVYTGEKGKAAGASRHGATGSPIIDGENIIVQVGSEKGASVVAFRKSDGQVVWKSQDDQTAYAAPYIAELAGRRQLLVFTVGALIALAPEDGKLLWRVPMETALGRHVTTPTVWKDVAMVGSHQIGMAGVRVEQAGDKLTAKEIWRNKDGAMNFTSPVVVGDHAYGIGPSKNVICIAAATGEIVWEKTGIIQSSPDRAVGAFIVMGANILLLTDTGELVLFAADPKAYREIGRTQVSGKTWCNPAYADGRLYLRDERQLRCVELVAQP